jgi:hypothetical protein
MHIVCTYTYMYMLHKMYIYCVIFKIHINICTYMLYGTPTIQPHISYISILLPIHVNVCMCLYKHIHLLLLHITDKHTHIQKVYVYT